MSQQGFFQGAVYGYTPEDDPNRRETMQAEAEQRITHQPPEVRSELREEARNQIDQEMARRAEASWIGIIIQKAKLENFFSQQEVDAFDTATRKLNAAMKYEIEREWYWDWHKETRVYTAGLFLQSQNRPSRIKMYRLLLANDVEPWMSILAFSHNSFSAPLDPNSSDIRADFYYNEEYPWAGYLITQWFLVYGDTGRFDQLRKDSFARRISHISPNAAVALKKAEETYDDNKGKIVFAGTAALGIAAVFAVASLATALK